MVSQSIAWFSLPVGRYRFVVPGRAPYVSLDLASLGLWAFTRLIKTLQSAARASQIRSSPTSFASLPNITRACPSSFFCFVQSFPCTTNPALLRFVVQCCPGISRLPADSSGFSLALLIAVRIFLAPLEILLWVLG